MNCKLYLFFLTLFFYYSGVAQMHDANWVVGTKTSVLSFENDTVVLDTLTQSTPFFLTSACISDETGELLYVCYGSAVTDRNGYTLLNGDTLSPCEYTLTNPYGFSIQQAALFIPKPDNLRYYYLLHYSLDTLNNGRPGTLYYSIIDKEGNFGLGEVIEKNHAFYKGIFRGGGMTACKHANGRDWWIIMGERNNNRYRTFLLTPSGITDTLTQSIGPNYNGPYDVAYSSFSEDGTKFATIAFEGYTTVFDFDRCNGALSNPLPIYNNASLEPINQPITGGASVAFSPNGRFLYVSTRLDLTQYDLWGVNIQDSSVIYKADSSDFAQMHFLEIATNGKLYGSTWNGGFKFLHVVNKPDEKGDSCSFVYAGQPTLSLNSTQLPNMPNYRLGALAGSGCDTITTGIGNIRDTNKPRLQPNPADKFVYIEMPVQGNYTFELVDEQGKLLERRETKQVDIINTEDLPSGVYYLRVTNAGRLVAAEKVIVRH